MTEVTAVLKALRRRWAIVLICTLLGAVLSAGYGLLRSDTYQSVATLAVSTATTEQSASSAYQGAMAANQRVSTYADLVTQSDVLPSVAEASGGEFTIAELEDAVVAVALPDTVLIEIRAEDEQPARAQQMAELTAVELSDMVQEIETPPGSQEAAAGLTMVGQPNEPTTPTGIPPWLLVFVGLFLGLAVGMVVALIRDFFDRTVRDTDSAVAIADTGLLGILYEAPRKDKKLAEGAGDALSRGGVNAESFRHLRTNLSFVDVDNPPRILLFTSSVPNEGKSYTSRNAALVLAEAGHRVLLIDADLRMLDGESELQECGDIGLTSVLAADLEIEDAVQTYSAGVDILPSGTVPPNPSELLASETMKSTLEQLRAQYDFVILDSPPVLPVADPLVLASHVDAVVFISRLGLVKSHQVTSAVDMLSKTGTRVAGLVVNGVKTSNKEIYGYGYGYGYGATPSSASSPGDDEQPAAHHSATQASEGASAERRVSVNELQAERSL